MNVAMEILKKHTLSLVCGVIAILAVVAWFWPIGGMYDDENVVLQTRHKAYEDLVRVVKSPRSWPITIEGDKQAPLKLFPNDARVIAGKEIKDRAHVQALEVQDMTVKPNAHVQLLTDVLPKPSERRFEFNTAYQRMVTDTMPKELKGTLPPTEVEVHAEADSIWNK